MEGWAYSSVELRIVSIGGRGTLRLLYVGDVELLPVVLIAYRVDPPPETR